MSIMFFKVRSLSRARGGNAVAKAAYISRDRLVDQRLGAAHDYRRTPGLQHSEIFVPEALSADARGWASDRSRLWNAAEKSETRVNSRVGTEYTIALPHELDHDVRRALARAFATQISERYGVAVDLAVHGPTQRGDPRNHHMHLLASTRELAEAGFGPKATNQLNTERRRQLGLGHIAQEFRDLRDLWAGLANERLREAAIEQRLEPRSRADLSLRTAMKIDDHGSEPTVQGPTENSLEEARRRGVERWRAYRREKEIAKDSTRDLARKPDRQFDNGFEI